MVHLVRNSVGYALGQMAWRAFLPWGAMFLLLPLILFLVSFMPQHDVAPPWWFYAAAGGIFLLCWVPHSRRAWMSLFDRSPQIELHATFLRARELDRDILWKDVWEIEWQGQGGHATYGSPESYLVLRLAGKKRRVLLDLIGLDMEGPRLSLLASDLRETDVERRRAGEEFEAAMEVAPAPEPVRTKGHSADELGEELEHFGPLFGRVFFICGVCFGGLWILGGSLLPLFALLRPAEDWPGVNLTMAGGGCCFFAFFGLAFIRNAVKMRGVRLVLCQYGMRFVGMKGRPWTLCYGDIRRTAVLTQRRVGVAEGQPFRILLLLRDGQAVELNNLKGIAAARQRIEELRRA